MRRSFKSLSHDDAVNTEGYLGCTCLMRNRSGLPTMFKLHLRIIYDLYDDRMKFFLLNSPCDGAFITMCDNQQL